MTGYEVAELLGLEAFHHEDGDDGAAYFLEDGRILKLTSSIVEAAACQGLLEAGTTCPNVPRIDLVHAFDELLVIPADQTVSGRRHEQLMRRFAIVRESFDDPFEAPSFDFLPALRSAWSTKDRHGLKLIASGAHGDVAMQVLRGLQHIETTTGVTVHDIRSSNIGQSR